ncbi:phosphodiester glycosidase family protein [Streptomyces sp. NPDC012769]|uniref:phosphodiester glycosidase family protein n=1 Tax=Streptomyces sp. NPDC012769 TaxID=3364848 RepID=UPI00369A1656
MTRNRRRTFAALAATVAALSLATSAGAAPAVEEPSSPLGTNWTAGAPVVLAPGVTHTTWTETKLDNRLKARVLQVVEIDPAAGAVTLESVIGASDAAAETVLDQLGTVTTVASRKPYAGVNGGLFQREPLPSGADGNVVHTSAAVTDGVLHSAACWNGGQGGNGAVIQYGIPYVTKLGTELKLSASPTASVRVDDVNRTPGRIPHCARDAEDRKVSDSPRVYADPDEIVVFTDDYGTTTPALTEGYEVVLGANGLVTAVHENRGGTAVPAGGRILQGIGTGAEWLRTHLPVGSRPVVETKLHDRTLGREIPLDESVDVVSSFHRLLEDGVVPSLDVLPNSCTATGEEPGKTDSRLKICTDSRTALGVDLQGHPLLITLTGQDNEDGDYLHDFATLLDSEELGLIDALNLDGGGSTTLVTGMKTRTPPTDTDDATGAKVHRKVADAVYTGVGGYGMYAK